MNALTFFKEDLEDQQELLRQLPKLSRTTKRAIIDDLLETYVAARVRNPSRTKVERKKTAPASEPKPHGSLLSVSEAAVVLGVTEDTIRKWARAGKIASVRLSKVDVRFRQVDVDEFIGSRLHRRKSAFRSS
jgi:excisionase family DNA binding protein